MTANILGILWDTFTLTHVKRRSVTLSPSLQTRNFSWFFYSTSSSFFFEASPFVILRFWGARSFLLHNRTLYFVDHMSLNLIFSISITTAGRVLEVCYFTTTTITTDSSLPFAQSCRLKKFTEGLRLPCFCQCRWHLQYLFCTCP